MSTNAGAGAGAGAGDPTCSRFQVSKSLLHTLTYHNQQPGIKINPKLFREVKMTKYNKVRIFQVLKVAKKSKAWAADPANRKCDAPGSWYCEGASARPRPSRPPLIESRQALISYQDHHMLP